MHSITASYLEVIDFDTTKAILQFELYGIQVLIAQNGITFSHNCVYWFGMVWASNNWNSSKFEHNKQKTDISRTSIG